MTSSYCILTRECPGCQDGSLRYSARFYAEPVDLSTPYNLLPAYIGCCSAKVVGTDVSITGMLFIGTGLDGVDKFRNHHLLDLFLQLLSLHPNLQTSTYERHKTSGLLPKTVNIPKLVKHLSLSPN